jgi:hypothetical protein
VSSPKFKHQSHKRENEREKEREREREREERKSRPIKESRLLEMGSPVLEFFGIFPVCS